MEVSLNCSNALFSLLIIEGQQQKDFFLSERNRKSWDR